MLRRAQLTADLAALLLVAQGRAGGAGFLRVRAGGAARAVAARLEPEGPVRVAGGAVVDAKGQGLVLFGAGWEWDGAKKELRAALAPGRPAVLAVLTRALPPPLPALTAESYDAERGACLKSWEELLG